MSVDIENNKYMQKVITNLNIADLPGIITNQFDSLEAVKNSLDNARNQAKNAQDEAKNRKKAVRFGHKKESIEDLQIVTNSLADAQIASTEAQNKLLEYQKKLTEMTSFLLALGLYNIAANRTVVREVELRLKNASENQISDLAKEELRNVLRQLKAQEDMMSKQQKLNEKVKEHHENIGEISRHIDSIETTGAEHGVLIGNIGAENVVQGKKIDELQGVISEHTEELNLRKNKDSEHDSKLIAIEEKDAIQDKMLSKIADKDTEQDRILSEIADKDAEQDEVLSNIARKDIEQDEKLSLRVKKDIEQDARLLAGEERGKHHEQLLNQQIKTDQIHDELFDQQAELNDEILKDIKNLEDHSKTIETSVDEIKVALNVLKETDNSQQITLNKLEEILTKHQELIEKNTLIQNQISEKLHNFINTQNETIDNINTQLNFHDEKDHNLELALEKCCSDTKDLYQVVDGFKKENENFAKELIDLKAENTQFSLMVNKLKIGVIISGVITAVVLLASILGYLL